MKTREDVDEGFGRSSRVWNDARSLRIIAGSNFAASRLGKTGIRRLGRGRIGIILIRGKIKRSLHGKDGLGMGRGKGITGS